MVPTSQEQTSENESVVEASVAGGTPAGGRVLPSRLERHRRRARKAALSALYAAELSHQPPVDVCKMQEDYFGRARDLTKELVDGVSRNIDRLDQRISSVAEHWALDRMPRVDLVVLRMAMYELEELSDIPTGATINEAVELAKCFSTTDSSRFVNGVLGKLATDISSV